MLLILWATLLKTCLVVAQKSRRPRVMLLKQLLLPRRTVPSNSCRVWVITRVTLISLE